MSSSRFRRIATSKPILLVELAILVFFGIHLGKEMIKKRAIEAEVAALEQDLASLSVKRDELGKLFEYVQTEAFVEEEARAKLNLVKQGEGVVLIPEVDATAETASADKAVPDKTAVLGAKEPVAVVSPPIPLQSAEPAAEPSNLKLWWQYFFDHDKLAE